MISEFTDPVKVGSGLPWSAEECRHGRGANRENGLGLKKFISSIGEVRKNSPARLEEIHHAKEEGLFLNF